MEFASQVSLISPFLEIGASLLAAAPLVIAWHLRDQELVNRFTSVEFPEQLDPLSPLAGNEVTSTASMSIAAGVGCRSRREVENGQ